MFRIQLTTQIWILFYNDSSWNSHAWKNIEIIWVKIKRNLKKIGDNFAGNSGSKIYTDSLSNLQKNKLTEIHGPMLTKIVTRNHWQREGICSKFLCLRHQPCHPLYTTTSSSKVTACTMVEQRLLHSFEKYKGCPRITETTLCMGIQRHLLAYKWKNIQVCSFTYQKRVEEAKSVKNLSSSSCLKRRPTVGPPPPPGHTVTSTKITLCKKMI